MTRQPPRSTLSSSSAASDVYKRQILNFKVTNGNAPAAVPPSPINISVVNCAFTGGVSLILTAVQSGASVWVDTVVTSDVSLTSNQFSESLIRINNLNTTTDGLSITTTAGFSNRTSYNISTVVVTTTISISPVSYTHLRAHETPEHLVCRLLLAKKKPHLQAHETPEHIE
eukprot:TRINITY_DN32855_c0_g1_i1.p1 TRINITY_DN32855_c0_g1~~TRINITY_DN32855_c0_g1_i1.p1  ORF type:complete len:171 (-),score=32.95 TRINITY_DN32855_c0_g1_i1:45-557(-)